jgi:hypothetical protein
VTEANKIYLAGVFDYAGNITLYKKHNREHSYGVDFRISSKIKDELLVLQSVTGLGEISTTSRYHTLYFGPEELSILVPQILKYTKARTQRIELVQRYLDTRTPHGKRISKKISQERLNIYTQLLALDQ